MPLKEQFGQARNKFGIVGYVGVMLHFVCGLAFTATIAGVRINENEKFFCFVHDKSTPLAYKKQVDQACFVRYNQAYHPHLPLYGFVILSIGLPDLVSFIYLLVVWKRVDEIQLLSCKRETNDEAENHGHGEERTCTINVFFSYFVHLVVRLLLGVIFTVLQYTYLYFDGFDLKYDCVLPRTEVASNSNTPKAKNVSRNLNETLSCENPTASEKWLLGKFVFAVNCIVILIVFGEVIYLCCLRLPLFDRRSEDGWMGDSKFVVVYLIGKGGKQRERVHLASTENNPTVIEGDNSIQETVKMIKIIRAEV